MMAKNERTKERGRAAAASGEGDAKPRWEAPRRRPVLGGVDLAVGALLLFGIWVGLPARWAPVDAIGTALALALGVAGFGLVTGQPWARRVALAVGWVTLAVGASTVTALAFTVSHLAGLYGPVGQGGALLLVFVALLLLPYLVIVPAAQLYALTRSEPDAR